MTFIAPAAFALGLLLPVIVAMYLLKLRRTEQQVSSVYLWRRMVRDVEANAPWQRLRANILLILQLLFLTALIFALARPFSWSEDVSGEAAIFILDTSASMSAVDIEPTRLEAAKQRARQMVDELPETARVTVIAAGDKAQVRLASSQDRRQAHLALEGIQASTGGSNLGVALELASAVAARQPNTELVVLSDGRVELPSRMALKGHLRYLPMGLSGENQAVSLLTLKPGPAGGSLTAFVQVTNYGEQPASRRLVLTADQRLVNAYDLDIPAGGQEAVIAEGLDMNTQVVEAHLEDADVLPLDDTALALPQEAHNVRVRLVSPQGNLFLATALQLLPGIELLEDLPVEPVQDETEPEDEPVEADLTIYDNTLPDPEQLPAGSLLFIAPTGSTPFFTTTGVVESPSLRPIDTTDPLLRHVSLAQVSVLDAVQIPLPQWATPVVAGDVEEGSVPLLFRGEVEGRRLAVLAFDLNHSDLPLQMAFPLLWVNLIDWLSPGGESELPDQVAPGNSLSFSLPASAQSATITRPDGTRLQVQTEGGLVRFADTAQLGIYEVQWAEEGNARFAVNLFLPAESDLKPAASLPGLETQAAQDLAQQPGQREWWRSLALLALGLLTGEWLVYQRAALARLSDWVRKRLRKA